MRRALVALLAAAAAFMAAGPAFASIPAHPKWRSSDPFGSWHNGGYIVYNNEWNGDHGPQSIWANSYKYWGAVSTQKAGNTAVETYPCVYDSAKPRMSPPAIAPGIDPMPPMTAAVNAFSPASKPM